MDFIPPHIQRQMDAARDAARPTNTVNFRTLATAHNTVDFIEPVEPQTFVSPTAQAAPARTSWFSRLRF